MRLIDADKLRQKDMNGDLVDIFDVLEAPTVEAIPSEWIRDYLDYSFLSPAEYWAIIKMTNKWMEQENDNQKRPI